MINVYVRIRIVDIKVSTKLGVNREYQKSK